MKLENIERKLIVLFCSFALLFCSPLVFAEVENPEGMTISEIKTAGNITITRKQILNAVQLRAGDKFNAAIVDKDTDRIGKIDGVEYSYYNLEKMDGGVALTYVVVERNIIRSIEFEGNDAYSDAFLARKANLKLCDYVDVLKANMAKETILEEYHKKGYPFVKVELDEEAFKVGQLHFSICEGERVKVSKICFLGNNNISKKELKAEIKTKKRKFLILPAYYIEEKVEEDVANLIKIYQSNGYLNVKVEPKVDFSSNCKKAAVSYVIDEGCIYCVEKIEISGNKQFSYDCLVCDNKLSVGSPFSDEKAEYDMKQILHKYRGEGYVDVQVSKERIFTSAGKVHLKYEIEEGCQFRIGRIEITGNQETHDKVVRRVLDESNFKPGELYNAEVARGDGQGALEQDVARTMMAESVLINQIEGAEGQKDAIVSVSESKTGMVMFGAGVDSSDGVIGQVVIEQRNFDIKDWPESWNEFIRGQSFKGAGQTMRLSLEPGTEVSRYSFDWTEPYLMDKPVGLNIGATKYERERESYDEDRLKGYVSLVRRYEDNWSFGLSTRYENVKIEDIDLDAPKEIQEVKGDNELFGLKLFASYDKRNSKYNPTCGYIFDVSYEQVGGDHDFGVFTTTYCWYKTLHEDLSERKTVLETKLHAGSIVGDAPVFEKFYAGGPRSLRGFDYRGAGPKGESLLVPGDYDDPIGSDWILLANAEVAVPLTSDTFSWLFFVDTGLLDDDEPRASVGTGLQVLVPQWFGPVPMRFEFAAPIAKDDDDDTQIFSFSVGRLF